MSRAAAEIPLSRVKRIQIYINQGKKSLPQIMGETGADYGINGGLYSGSKAVCHLRADGYTYATDPYTYWGYLWDAGPDIHMGIVPEKACANYISCVELIRDGKTKDKLTYNSDVGGRRGRSAIGLRGDHLCLYCAGDGSPDAMTPEVLRDYLQEQGWESAVMLDGGGSSQCDFAGEQIISSRKVHNYILVYLEKSEDKPMGDKKYKICLDPGHGPNTVNGSPDGSYKEQEFAWDMGQRIKPLLEGQGMEVKLTRTKDNKPSLTERAETSNEWGADVFLSLHSNAAGNGGWYDARGLSCITSSGPDTANRNKLARAILARASEAGVVLRSNTPSHDMSLTVLVKTDAPAVLIEYGFHTSKDDVALLKDDTYRDTLALATAKGVCDYLGISWADADSGAGTNTAAADWAADAWEKARDKGILDGTRPTDPVVRQELAVVLDRLGLL